MSDAIRIGQRVTVAGKANSSFAGLSGTVEAFGDAGAIVAFDEGSKIAIDFADIVPIALLEKYIIVTGNPVDGFEFIGPFGYYEEAEESVRLYSVLATADWWIAEIGR